MILCDLFYNGNQDSMVVTGINEDDFTISISNGNYVNHSAGMYRGAGGGGATYDGSGGWYYSGGTGADGVCIILINPTSTSYPTEQWTNTSTGSPIPIPTSNLKYN